MIDGCRVESRFTSTMDDHIEPAADRDGHDGFYDAIVPLVREILGIDLTTEPVHSGPSEATFEAHRQAALDGDKTTIPALEAFIAAEEAHVTWLAADAKYQTQWKQSHPEDDGTIFPAPFSPRIHGFLQAHYDAVKVFEDLIASWDKSNRERLRARRRKLAEPIPQFTFEEARHLVKALMDAPAVDGWEALPTSEAPALRHIVAGKPFEVLLTANGSSGRATEESLRAELRSLGFRSGLLALGCIGLVIAHGEMTVTLDELMQLVGLRPRSEAERSERRAMIWSSLQTIGRAQVYGRRSGKFADSKTKKALDLSVTGPLLLVSTERTSAQALLDGDDPPSTVTLRPSTWLDGLRGNAQVLTYFGDLSSIVSIPDGTPSGALAQRIGIFLNQRWRESARKAEVIRVGETKHETAKYQSFTRRGVLEFSKHLAEVEAILRGPAPQRAMAYWEKAIDILKTVQVVGHYKDLGRLTSGRKGWQDEWLDQRIDIRPGRVGTKAIVALHGKSAVAGTKKKRATPKATPSD